MRVTLELEPAVIEGDRALLERLAANLLENGVRYNRPGGFVGRAHALVDGAAELEVENSGPLVDPAAAGRLAEPFERLERSADGGGAGLGLSIVRAVGEAHGGSLAIEPRDGGGLRVVVRLPTGAARPATGSQRTSICAVLLPDAGAPARSRSARRPSSWVRPCTELPNSPAPATTAAVAMATAPGSHRHKGSGPRQGRRPNQRSERAPPSSSRAAAPPAKAAVTWRLSSRVATREPSRS